MDEARSEHGLPAILEPPRWGNTHHGGRDAYNLAATAMVAAKVYDAYKWVRWDPRSPYIDGAEYHVPDAEALLKVLHDLACLALDHLGEEHYEQVGTLRFIAYADDDGADSYVNFYLSIGQADAREVHGIHRRAAAESGRSTDA